MNQDSLGLGLASASQAPVSTPTPSKSKNKKVALATVVVGVFVLVFFVLPVVPYTFASYNFGQVGSYCEFGSYCPTVSVTGFVSPSYSLFKCGLVVSNGASGQFMGVPYSYSGSTGWAC
jgi:hypothetical protein